MEQRITIRIQGADYTIITDESSSFITSLASELDKDITDLLDADPRMSLISAAVLCSLDSKIKLGKQESGADNMRSQLKDYLEESSKMRIELEEAKRRVAELTYQNKELKEKIK